MRRTAPGAQRCARLHKAWHGRRGPAAGQARATPTSCGCWPPSLCCTMVRQIAGRPRSMPWQACQPSASLFQILLLLLLRSAFRIILLGCVSHAFVLLSFGMLGPRCPETPGASKHGQLTSHLPIDLLQNLCFQGACLRILTAVGCAAFGPRSSAAWHTQPCSAATRLQLDSCIRTR